MRSEKAVFAALIYERHGLDASRTEVEIGRQHGGYFTRTKLYEEEDKTFYLSVGKDEEQDWSLGVRMKWRF